MQNQNRVEIGEESFGLLHSVGMGSKESEREEERERFARRKLSDEVKGKHMEVAANWIRSSNWGD